MLSKFSNVIRRLFELSISYYFLHLFHSRKALSKEQEAGNKQCEFKCNTCTKRFVKDSNEYYKYNSKKPCGDKGSISTIFKSKDTLVGEMERRCIMRNCICAYNHPSEGGCPENKLCKKCYIKYFTYRKPRNEETWKNAKKKDFMCPNCKAPFHYEEDLIYHHMEMCRLNN